jgi:hypothetical protein
MEAWVYMTTSSSSEMALFGVDVTTGPLFEIYLQKLYLGSRGTAYDVGASVTVPQNTWTHLAITRRSGAVTLWQDGVSVGSGNVTRDYPVGPIVVGTFDRTGGSAFFQGYIDDLRVTKGVARYTANFTPPQVALPRQ